MPKEPRLNPTAYWRVHRRFQHGPAGRSSQDWNGGSLEPPFCFCAYL